LASTPSASAEGQDVRPATIASDKPYCVV